MPGYTISAEPVLRAGVSATKFVVHEAGSAGHEQPHDHTDDDDHRSTCIDHDAHARTSPGTTPHRSLPEIFELIDRSALSSIGQERAKALFRRLAEAEARIHQMPVEQVHLTKSAPSTPSSTSSAPCSR